MTDTRGDMVNSFPTLSLPHILTTLHDNSNNNNNNNNNTNNNNRNNTHYALSNEELSDTFKKHPLNSAMYGYQGLHICHLNVRSLLNKLHEIKKFLKNKNVQILTISESWLADSINSNEVYIEGYNLFRQDRSYKINKKNKKNKRAGGLCFYIRDDIVVDINSLSSWNRNCIDIEAMWVKCKFDSIKDLIIGNFYRPPKGNKTKFINYLIDLSNDIKTYHSTEMYLLGDINICLKNKDNVSNLLIDCMKICGLTQIIDKSTRLGNVRNSLLDHIYTNSKNICNKGTGFINISDHMLIFCTRKKCNDKSKDITFTGRKINLNLIDNFKNDVGNHNWADIIEMNDSNLIWSTIEERLNTIADRYFPIKTLKKKNDCDKWLTKELVELMNDRDKWLLKASKSGDANDKEEAHKMRNYVNRKLKKAKKEYFKNKIEINIKDSKKLWSFINDLMPNKKNSNRIQILDDSNTPFNLNEMPDIINTFFNQVGKNNPTEPSFPIGPIPEQNFNLQTVTVNQVTELIEKINTNKSSSIKNLPSKLLKEGFLMIPNILTFLFNKIIINSTIPDNWKKATIIPIKKTTNCTSPSDLRPISLLPLPSKLLEKLIYNQVIKHLIQNKYLDPNQFGFQKNKSTITTLTEFTDDIYTAIENNNLTASIFIDFTKAFDRINHKILLEKLKFFAFSDPTLKFFENYLSNRTQITLVNNHFSSPLQITHGVPQGSNLGPLLFLLYVNDINLAIKNTNFKLFADDTTIYTSDTNIDNIINKLNIDLESINQWCVFNNMMINKKKTKLMIFGRNNKIKKCKKINEIKIDNTSVQQVTQYKYLGITLDEKLNFNTHINTMIRNVSHKMYLLKRTNIYLTEKSSLMVYKSFILPLLEYGNILYMKSCNKLLDKLQRMQNQCLKVCLNQDIRSSTAEIHKKANLNYLNERRQKQLIKTMYSRSKNPKYLDPNDYEVKTRSNTVSKLYVPKFKNSQAKKSILFHGSVSWNDLPYDLKKIEFKNLFSFKIDNLYKNKIKEY